MSGVLTGTLYGSRAEPVSWLTAVLAGVATHVLVASAALSLKPAPKAAAMQPPVSLERIVELTPPEPPADKPLPPPESPKARAVVKQVALSSKPVQESANPPDSKPASAAGTGAVIARLSDNTRTEDFADFTVVSGEAGAYAGGVSASWGRSTNAVHAADVSPDGAMNGSGRGTLAAPVRLSARDWKCPWPKEADALRIDEQVVVIRVLVRPDGVVSRAELLSDPGNGFGPAALGCAEQTRFEPATDEAGKPYVSTSPPIRVRFTR